MIRRITAALATVFLSVVAMAAVPTAAQAAAPGQCTTSYGGPVASATCTGVPAGTTWQANDYCFYVIDGQPIDYRRYGTVVTGNGTSNIYCDAGDYATNNVQVNTLSVVGPQGRLVGYGGKCVDVAGASTKPATHVQIYDCNGTAAQWWTMATDGTVRALGMCLNVAQGSAANGTHVESYTCVQGWQSEQWTQQSDGSLRNTLTGKCLDDPNSSTANKTWLQIYDCNGHANQKWALTP